MQADRPYARSENEPLSGMTLERLIRSLSLDKPFRAKQVFKWIADGARDFNDMTNLPLSLRESLGRTRTLFDTKIAKTLKDPDGTVKLQIALRDGGAVETVLLTDQDGRKTACVSCQVGCPMGCAFCQTGHIGYAGNLATGEIIEQFYHLEDAVGRLDNIVFMGMGEPMLNLSAIREAIAILTDPEGRALSKRRITISTSGVAQGIMSLADEGPDVRLAVSLTTANPALRERLMPVSRGNPLPELKRAIAHYCDVTGKRVTLEAALLSGVNTGEDEAERMAEFAKGLNVHLNLIPWNPVPALEFTSPSSRETEAFVRLLERKGLNVTLRTRRGRTIGGACGQLGRSSEEDLTSEGP